MLNDEICKLREELNESIEKGADYSITYKLSVKLDHLIAKYYQNDEINGVKNNKSEKRKTITIG